MAFGRLPARGKYSYQARFAPTTVMKVRRPLVGVGSRPGLGVKRWPIAPVSTGSINTPSAFGFPVCWTASPVGEAPMRVKGVGEQAAAAAGPAWAEPASGTTTPRTSVTVSIPERKELFRDG